MSGMLFSSLIDVEKWDRAKWTATAFFVMQDGSAPPCLGLVFENGNVGKKIFADLIERLDKEDKYEELRIAIIEGDIPGERSGYSVHISSNPEHTAKRAKDQGTNLDFSQAIVVSRIHRMNPEPGSPYLGNFKQAYYKHGKYLFIPVSLSTDKSSPVTSHFDLSVGKIEIHFRSMEDIVSGDRDMVIFAKE